MTLAAGASVDLSSIYRVQSSMQNAVDSAVLAAAREVVVENGTNQLDDYAEDVFKANYSGPVGDDRAFLLFKKMIS